MLAVLVLSFNTTPVAFTMLSSIVKATAILALVRTATSWALPGTFNHDAPASLKVPWKERGLYSGSAVKSVAKRDEKGYSTGCNHGPAARSCWKDNYNVDTDMDLEWPTTGNVVKASCREDLDCELHILTPAVPLRDYECHDGA